MKSSLVLALLLLGCCAGQIPAQVPAAAHQPEVVVRKAIPVEEPAPVNLSTLPHTRPADVKMIYSQCVVEDNAIAITFDDGPDPKNTPRLLDMLKERGIKATFFLVGKCAATWPDIVKRMIEEGHEVGNHTWNHYQLTRLGESKVLNELQTTHDAIVKACGVTPILYRPPYGATRLSQQKLIHDHFDYTAVLWDVDPLDWKAPRSAAKVHERVLKQTKAGSIILCHDIHRETVDAMPATLDDLKARGFQFVTVTQLFNIESQTLANRAAVVAAAKAQSAAVEVPPAATQAAPAANEAVAPAATAATAQPAPAAQQPAAK